MEKIIEDLYKVQLPKEFCENLGFEIGSHVEVSIDNNSIKIEIQSPHMDYQNFFFSRKRFWFIKRNNEYWI